MSKETTQTTPFESIIAIQGEIQGLKKDTNNPFFKSKYMNLGAIVGKIKPILHKNNCFSTHQVKIGDSGRHILESKICYKDGTVLLDCQSPLLSKDPNDPQKLGSAITYMRRYNLTAMLEIEEDDDDGNEASQGKSDQKKLANVSDKDMIETLRKENEKQFSRIKDDLEACGSVQELESVIEKEKSEINKLAKYAKDLFVMLKNSKEQMIKVLDPEEEES